MINFKENNVKVNYSDLIEIGFEKEYLNDHVHLSQYGYPYFVLAYGKDSDKVSMEWSPTTREVNLYLNSQTYQKALTLVEVKKIVKMLEEEM